VTLVAIVCPWSSGADLELVDAALLARPTRDYTTRLRYVETVVQEQLTAAAQRAVTS
jgi:hypothetical protein